MKVDYVQERNALSVTGDVFCRYCGKRWDGVRRFYLCRDRKYVYCEMCVKESSREHPIDCYHLEIFDVKKEAENGKS